MKNILITILKALGTRRALEVIISVFKWISEQTPTTADDKVVKLMEELYELLYPFIPAKKRHG